MYHSITIGTKNTWVTADTEQEYVDKLLRLAGASSQTGEKHPFKAYAANWFEVFSRPNVASVTSLTYERQLNNHIYPALGDKMIEDVTTADVQKIFNDMPDDAKQETKTRLRSF